MVAREAVRRLLFCRNCYSISN